MTEKEKILWQQWNGYISSKVKTLPFETEFKLKDLFQLSAHNDWSAEVDGIERKIVGSERQIIGRAFQSALENDAYRKELSLQELGIKGSRANVDKYTRVGVP